MKILRITNKEKPILEFLEHAWETPDEQDIPTTDIIKWLRSNLYRHDVGLWLGFHESKIVFCVIAMGPSILFPSAHVYCAWAKKGAPVDTKEFFDGTFAQWVRGLGCDEITMCSCGRPARVWERKFGFKSWTHMYRKSLEPMNLELAELSRTFVKGT